MNVLTLIVKLTNSSHRHPKHTKKEESSILPANEAGDKRDEKAHADVGQSKQRHAKRDLWLGQAKVGQNERRQHRKVEFSKVCDCHADLQRKTLVISRLLYKDYEAHHNVDVGQIL